MDTQILINAIGDIALEARNFKKDRNGLKWTYSCIVCGDSMTDRRKARFGIAIKSGSAVVHCFNCGYSNTFMGYIKDFHPRIYERVNAENFFDKAPTLYDLNPLLQKLPARTLINIFFIKKFKETESWMNHIQSKKIQLSKENMRKLELLHNKYWELQK